MCAYRYKNLNRTGREIRVLRFQYTTESDQGSVACTLHHVSLDDLHPYHERFLKGHNSSVSYFSNEEAWIRNALTDEPLRDAITTPHVLESWRLQGISMIRESRVSPTVNVPSRFTWGDFEAVSYCWESDVRDQEVLVDNVPVQVPQNLAAALRQLRHLPESRSGMAFWIDGLCINQEDLAEKNHQVNLMKQIYSEALSTIVWLGSADEQSNKAASAINSHHRTPEGSEEELTLEEWDAVLGLWSRNYFQRMWIIQELAMNKLMSFFMCGDRYISRRAMQGISNDAQRQANYIAGRMMTTGMSSRTHSEVWQLTYHIETLLSISASTLQHDRLDILLDLARKAKAKDARDKIYGLLGLLDRSLASQIIPRYDRPKEEIYLEFAKLMLERCRSLDEVFCWCAYATPATLPSWIPDWTSPIRRNHLQWFRRQKASSYHKPVWSISGTTLRTRAVKVGTVASLSAAATAMLPYGQALMSPTAGTQQSSSLAYTSSRYDGEEGLKIALNRTLAHDHPMWRTYAWLTDIYWENWSDDNTTTPHRPPLESNDWLSDHWEYFDKFRQSNADFLVFGHSLRAFFPARPRGDSGNELFRQTETARDFYAQNCCDETTYTSGGRHTDNMRLAAVALQGRRLLTTHCGFLGLAPEEVVVGDTIAVLIGCNYPVILRQRGTGFVYVDECYVDGLMAGEAIEAASRGEYHVEDIDIV